MTDLEKLLATFDEIGVEYNRGAYYPYKNAKLTVAIGGIASHQTEVNYGKFIYIEGAIFLFGIDDRFIGYEFTSGKKAYLSPRRKETSDALER